ncbi:hypothetical protein [Nocardia fluminea]|uniref:hypothetical protein n=1 Tax=Nocardia fluminea TaxID=134984 RepID=UPI00365557C6
MNGITVTHHGHMVDIEITDRSVADSVRTALLDAAGSYPRAVATTTHHSRPGYRVTRDLAERAGLLDADLQAEPKPTPAPKKAAAKKVPAKVIPSVEVGGGAPEEAANDAK